MPNKRRTHQASYVPLWPSATVRGCYPRRMDREMLRQHLQQTEKHLAASDELITDQRALIARLEERGYDTAKARTALAHLEEMRKLHIADRDRLSRALRELGE
jgi:hypothetical protein